MRMSDIPAIAQLSMPEKLLLVEDLWDSIALDATSLVRRGNSLPQWERSKHVSGASAEIELQEGQK